MERSKKWAMCDVMRRVLRGALAACWILGILGGEAGAQEYAIDCAAFCANEFDPQTNAVNGQNCAGMTFVKKDEQPVNLSWTGWPYNSCCGPAHFRCQPRSWANNQCRCAPRQPNAALPAGQCQGSTGSGDNFLFNCDQICGNPDRARNPCAGVYWKQSNGVLKATNVGDVNKRNCQYGPEHVAQTVGADWNQCACSGGGPLPPNRCAISHDWMVECTTYCTNVRIEPNGRNCFGVYWLNTDGTREFTEPTAGGDCKDPGGNRSLKRADIEARCGGCRDAMLTPPNVPAPATRLLNSTDLKTKPMTQATRNELTALLAQIRGWAPCADWNQCDKAPGTNEMRCTPAQIRPCASFPDGQGLVGAMYLPDTNPGFVGDSVGPAGMACLAGETARCNDVRIAQDRAGAFGPAGAFYRSAAHMRVTGNYSAVYSDPPFSRDHLIGVLAYWLATKDFDSIDRWIDFVKSNPRHSPFFVNICPGGKQGATTDDRCNAVPSTWANVARVLKHIGYDMSRLQGKLGNFVMTAPDIDILTTTTEAGNNTVLGEHAYTAGDTFDVAVIYNRMGFSMAEAFRRLNTRSNDRSPLYHLFHTGYATEWLGWLIRAYCPASKPDWDATAPSIPDRVFANHGQPERLTVMGTNLFVWQYETFGGRNVVNQISVSNGHDCVELIRWALSFPIRPSPGSAPSQGPPYKPATPK